MELYRLGAEDYTELIDLLDSVFSRKNQREQHFEEDLPKMCVADDLHMNRHLGIREDGKLVAALGIYPLPTVVEGTPLLFSTVGNVATRPEYEGRGYMGILLDAAMKELERIGADGSRLGGLRPRYNRYGYESAGAVYKFTFTPSNLKHYFPGFTSELEFKLIEKDDIEALAYTWKLYSRNKITVNRLELPDYLDVYKSITAWCCRGFLAVRKDGTPVGYISVDLSDSVAEWGAESMETAREMMAQWQVKVQKAFSIPVAPYEREALAAFGKVCESVYIASPSHFKIIHWDKVVDAFLRLKASYADLPSGAWVLEIEDYGRIKLTVDGKDTGCCLTEEEPDVVLDKLTATGLLFGPLPAETMAPVPQVVRTWLPLPLSWNLQDRV